MVTLAALFLAHGIDMHSAAETELARVWTKVEQIRAKQAGNDLRWAAGVIEKYDDATIEACYIKRQAAALALSC